MIMSFTLTYIVRIWKEQGVTRDAKTNIHNITHFCNKFISKFLFLITLEMSKKIGQIL